MPKYPLGIQTFEEIRTGGYLYVDKTEHVHRMTEGKYYFLSRPRRFGKSLLVSTLKSLYEGRRDLFEGLWIEDKWDWDGSNPILLLQFNAVGYGSIGLRAALTQWLELVSTEFGVELITSGYDSQFSELIRTLYRKTGRKVVVLIDEYDKPIIDYLTNISKAEEHRDILKSFYGVLKPSDPYIELVLITGVSKFARTSIFSDLNNISDITLSKHFGIITGITQNEMEHYLGAEINQIADDKGVSRSDLLSDIKQWYNGYTWDLNNWVYNPYSLLSYFSEPDILKNYWFETGTPTFLLEQLKKSWTFDFKNVRADDSMLNSFQLDGLNPYSLLFQTGYLTISQYHPEERIYSLRYPNHEVRYSLTQYLLRYFREAASDTVVPTVVDLRDAFLADDIEHVVSLINNIFSTIPATLWDKQQEKYYHSLVHLTFILLGTYIQSDPFTARGRCDAIVHTPNAVYALEFKLNKSAEEAQKQIKERGYLDPFLDGGKNCIGVGVNFTSERKGIADWNVVEY